MYFKLMLAKKFHALKLYLFSFTVLKCVIYGLTDLKCFVKNYKSYIEGKFKYSYVIKVFQGPFHKWKRVVILSDFYYQVLYVFMFHQDFEEGQAHVTSVAEFLLSQPLLSFVVCQVKRFRLKSHVQQSGKESGDSHVDDDSHTSHLGLEEIATGQATGKKCSVQLQLFCIQTK